MYIAYNDEYTRVSSLSTQFESSINELAAIDIKMSVLLSQILQSQKHYISTLYDSDNTITTLTYNHSTCSDDDVTLTQALLDDGTVTAAEGRDGVAQYTFQSNARVSHLSTHVR